MEQIPTWNLGPRSQFRDVPNPDNLSSTCCCVKQSQAETRKDTVAEEGWREATVFEESPSLAFFFSSPSNGAKLWGDSSSLKGANTFKSWRHSPKRCATSCFPGECFRNIQLGIFKISTYCHPPKLPERWMGWVRELVWESWLQEAHSLPDFLSHSQRSMTFASRPCLWRRKCNASDSQTQSSQKP